MNILPISGQLYRKIQCGLYLLNLAAWLSLTLCLEIIYSLFLRPFTESLVTAIALMVVDLFKLILIISISYFVLSNFNQDEKFTDFCSMKFLYNVLCF